MSTSIPDIPVAIKQEHRPKNPVNSSSVITDKSGAGVETPVAPAGPGKGTEFHSIPRPIAVNVRGGTTGNDPVVGFLPCKRQDQNSTLDPRTTKVQCLKESAPGFYILKNVRTNVSDVYNKERQQLKDQAPDDLDRTLAKHGASGIESSLPAPDEENIRLQGELEKEKQKYAALAGRYDELKARYIHQVEHMSKEFDAEKKKLQIEISNKTAELETTNRWRREDLRKVEQQLDDRQTKLNAQLVSHNDTAMAQLAKTYDKRIESIQAQCESQYRIQLTEQKYDYEKRIAELEAKLAAKHQDVELCNEIRKANELIPQLIDGITFATPKLVDFKDNVAEIMNRARDMNDQTNRLQGFVSGWQMSMPRLPSMQPPVYFPAPPPPPGSGGRVRHGAFHCESGPQHP